jgi:hypothetical protein
MFFARLLFTIFFFLFPIISLSAPVPIPGQITHSDKPHRSLPLPAKRFFNLLGKRSQHVPAPGLTESALNHCFFVGSDFLPHDCNEVVKVDSLNAPKTPEQFALVASVSSSLAAAKAKATPV